MVSCVRDGRASRGWLWAGFLVFALLLGACGGGDDGVASFASDDGVVSVDVPSGAAPDGFSGSVSLSDPSALGLEMSDLESVVLVYELGPDGTEFGEPVTVTFRITSSIGNFDPALGLPISLVGIEDGVGGFEPLGSTRSFYDGDVLVIEGTTTHFSKAVAIVEEGRIELILDPEGNTKEVGSSFNAVIGDFYTNVERSLSTGFDVGRVDYSTQGPIDIISSDTDTATLKCTAAGKGVIVATVFGQLDVNVNNRYQVFANLFTGGSATLLGDLSLEIECVDEPAASPATTSTTEPSTGSDPKGDAGSTTTTLRTDGVDPPNDQTDSNGDLHAEGKGKPGGDIVGVRHESGATGLQYFIIDVVADGEETSKDSDIYSVFVEFEAPDGEVFLVDVRYDLGTAVAVLRGSDTGRPEIEGTLVTAVWEDSDTLRVCVDGGETSVDVQSFRVQINIVSPGQDSWVDSALGLAG